MQRKGKRRKYLPIEAVLRLAQDGPIGTKRGKRGYTRKVKHKHQKEE
jgi:hypothetical protein